MDPSPDAHAIRANIVAKLNFILDGGAVSDMGATLPPCSTLDGENLAYMAPVQSADGTRPNALKTKPFVLKKDEEDFQEKFKQIRAARLCDSLVSRLNRVRFAFQSLNVLRQIQIPFKNPGDTCGKEPCRVDELYNPSVEQSDYLEIAEHQNEDVKDFESARINFPPHILMQITRNAPWIKVRALLLTRQTDIKTSRYYPNRPILAKQTHPKLPKIFRNGSDMSNRHAGFSIPQPTEIRGRWRRNRCRGPHRLAQTSGALQARWWAMVKTAKQYRQILTLVF